MMSAPARANSSPPQPWASRRAIATAWLAALLALACAPTRNPPPGPPGRAEAPPLVPQTTSVPLTFIDHFAVVPVRVNGAVDTRMVLDTGIGVTVLSAALCQRVGCARGGEYTGERMSGQRITIPLARLASLSLAGREVKDLQIGIIDNPALLPPGIDGILSLGFFEAAPFTLDYQAGALYLEDMQSLARREAAGSVVQLSIDRDAASVTAFMSLDLPNGPPVKTEIDSGSDSLILDERFMARLGVAADATTTKRIDGTDETGHSYARHFATIAGSIAPTAAPQMKQEGPRVMFQRIIHDGLIGRSFLQGFAVTFDLPRSRLILGPPARQP